MAKKRTAPKVECEQQHAEFVVRNVPAAVKYYEQKLGFSKSFTWGKPVTFGGVIIGSQQIFLAKGTPNPKGLSVSFVVGNVDELYGFHRDAGVMVDARGRVTLGPARRLNRGDST